MMVLLSLLTAAWAGDLRVDADVDALATRRDTFAVYAGKSYAGMAMLDGMEEDDGGATLVVRYVPAGQDDPAWVEGVTVDADGKLTRVVYREGRKLRTLTVDGGVVHDVIREGGVEGPVLIARDFVAPAASLSSPWLVVTGMDDARGLKKGDAWNGGFIDGAVVTPGRAGVTWQGQVAVGGGRNADVANISTSAGAWTLVFDADGDVAAIVRKDAGTQWVAADRAQVQQTHDQAGAARK